MANNVPDLLQLSEKELQALIDEEEARAAKTTLALKLRSLRSDNSAAQASLLAATKKPAKKVSHPGRPRLFRLLSFLRRSLHGSRSSGCSVTPVDHRRRLRRLRRRFLPGRRLKQAVELVQTPAAALPVAPPANAAPSMFSSSSSSARSPVTSAATSIQSQTESVQCTEASPPQQRLGGQRCDKRAEPTPRRIGLELCPPPAQGQVRRVSPRQASPRTRRRRAS